MKPYMNELPWEGKERGKRFRTEAGEKEARNLACMDLSTHNKESQM